ncbi:MAG: hypothetical protein WC755_00430 [Candidatus Woesearchaeota archaeon]|jgi:hypothetical protein
MRYEVLEKYNPKPNEANAGIPTGTPLEVRIIPEETNLRQLFTAMVQSAYEMEGTPGLGGIATLNEPNSITQKDAERYILYDSQRTFTDKILRRPDIRVPRGIMADNIKGRAVKLNVFESKKINGTYEMSAYTFARDVGSIYVLFELTHKKLN